MKNYILIFICTIVFSGCFKENYMCDNEETAIKALRIEKNDDIKIKDDYFKEQTDRLLSGIKITNIGLIEVNDKKSYSVCRAKYSMDLKNENVIEYLIFLSTFQNLLFFDMQDQKGLKYHFEKFKTGSAYSEMFERFKKGAITTFFSSEDKITYKTRDNGRGEIWIEVLE